MSVERSRGRRKAAVLIPMVVTTVALVAAVPWARAQTSTAHVQNSGPWTDIWLGSDLSCQAATSPTGDQFFGGEPGDCGTMLQAGGSVYGPQLQFFTPSTTFTETSQTGVTGDGTVGNPYTVVTDVSAGATGLTLEETETYVTGESEFHATVTISNGSEGSQDVVLYHAADCLVGGSDTGFGSVGGDGAIGCQSASGDLVEFVPVTTSGVNHLEAGFDAVWSAVSSGSPFGDTCDCSTDEDNGMGLSWSASVPGSGSTSISFATRWTPGTSSADLGVTKSDSAEGFGPDPVSSGGVVAYEVTATNGGPDDATGIVVQDSVTGGSIISASGGSESGWDCTADESGSWTCALDGLASGSSAPPITVLVQAPTTTTNTTISDTATISGNQSDPNSGNDSATETTTVTGSGTSGGKDSVESFYTGSSPLTIQTSSNDTFSSQLTLPPGLAPGVVSIDEVPGTTPQFLTFCGGQACRPQLQVFDLPDGTASANNPIKDILFYKGKYKKGGPVYAAPEGATTGELVPDCTTPGVADPAKCVDSVTRLHGGVLRIVILMLGGSDPAGRH